MSPEDIEVLAKRYMREREVSEDANRKLIDARAALDIAERKYIEARSRLDNAVAGEKGLAALWTVESVQTVARLEAQLASSRSSEGTASADAQAKKDVAEKTWRTLVELSA